MRWCENSVERARRYAAELVALTPDVILAANPTSSLCGRFFEGVAAQ
jgi:hypothetical protein